TSRVAERVSQARQIADSRGISHNVAIAAEQADVVAPLADEARSILVRAVDEGRLSARGVHRVRCVARTVADLDGHDGELSARHVATALALRAELVGHTPYGAAA
ncbi:MAG: hypothetical protein ACC660_08725, partial [Acidimicrobiales bacterium]